MHLRAYLLHTCEAASSDPSPYNLAEDSHRPRSKQSLPREAHKHLAGMMNVRQGQQCRPRELQL